VVGTASNQRGDEADDASEPVGEATTGGHAWNSLASRRLRTLRRPRRARARQTRDTRRHRAAPATMAVSRADPGGPVEAAPLTVTITTMRRRHLRGVLHIEQQVYPKPWTFGLFLSELGQRSTRLYLVARVGHRIVGYLGLLRNIDEGHITNVAVDPEWQGHGIATRLLATAGRAASLRGCRSLTLEVRVSNDRAQQLYRRFGFAPAGVRKAYYPDNREDAIIMWANDIDSPDYARRLLDIESTLDGYTLVEGDWV
jgi:[ribosomal protein S18]-alanine N-acetyltransferase